MRSNLLFIPTSSLTTSRRSGPRSTLRINYCYLSNRSSHDIRAMEPRCSRYPKVRRVTATKSGIQVTVASLMIVSSVFHEAESSIQPQSLGRVCDPVGIAEGPTAIDAAKQRRHLGFRLRLVDKLQPTV